MEDWPAVVAKWFDDNDPDASLTRVAPSGNSPERISALERTLGVTLPDQMRQLYLAVDGFDLCDKPDESPTFVKSVDSIPAYAKQERSYLSDTHREFAENYLPFIDFWICLGIEGQRTNSRICDGGTRGVQIRFRPINRRFRAFNA
jgi:hypothetical protein